MAAPFSFLLWGWFARFASARILLTLWAGLPIILTRVRFSLDEKRVWRPRAGPAGCRESFRLHCAPSGKTSLLREMYSCWNTSVGKNVRRRACLSNPYHDLGIHCTLICSRASMTAYRKVAFSNEDTHFYVHLHFFPVFLGSVAPWVNFPPLLRLFYDAVVRPINVLCVNYCIIDA